MRAYTEWINVNDIVPNSLNPRKNDAIRSEEIQSIIKKKGWETPITAYKKGGIYVVLSGHRRLYAAKEAKMKEIPVFVVEAPKNSREEIERIASLQGGQVDWSTYEWANVYYERWIASGKPSMIEFSRMTGANKTTLKEYIRVFESYPRHEIESKIENGTFSMIGLSYAVRWMETMKEKFPALYTKLGKDIIRRALLNKFEHRAINATTVRNKKFFEVAREQDVQEFLTTVNMKVEDVLERHNINPKEKTVRGVVHSTTKFMNMVKDFEDPYAVDDKIKMAEKYREAAEALMSKVKELEKQIAKEQVYLNPEERKEVKREKAIALNRGRKRRHVRS